MLAAAQSAAAEAIDDLAAAAAVDGHGVGYQQPVPARTEEAQRLRRGHLLKLLLLLLEQQPRAALEVAEVPRHPGWLPVSGK